MSTSQAIRCEIRKDLKMAPSAYFTSQAKVDAMQTIKVAIFVLGLPDTPDRVDGDPGDGLATFVSEGESVAFDSDGGDGTELPEAAPQQERTERPETYEHSVSFR